jgi:hypothetical protein
VVLRTTTTGDIPCDRILAAAAEADLASVMVLGWSDGGDFYLASSGGDAGGLLLLIEMAKRTLFETMGA